MMKQQSQQGYIVLMGIMMLLLGATVWFGTAGNVFSNSMAIAKNDDEIKQLQQVKEKMLAYAMIHPEMYSDGSSVPGPGYFPCPDENGDGNSNTFCGTDSGVDELFVIGRVPYTISSRFFTFLDNQLDNNLYWYAVDSRFVHSSATYRFDNSTRFANLNSDLTVEVDDSSGTPVAPFTVDGQDEIVMVLFYAGDAFANQDRVASPQMTDYLEQSTVTSGETIDFQSTGAALQDFNDYVITISREEWLAAVMTRVAQDVNPEDGTPDLCSVVDANTAHWFNDCTYDHPTNRPAGYVCDGNAIDNLAGQGWRNLVNCN